MMFRCYCCGKIFYEPKRVEEPRGEYWGVPCTETMYYSPCCTDDFEEVDDKDEEDGYYETEEEAEYRLEMEAMEWSFSKEE